MSVSKIVLAFALTCWLHLAGAQNFVAVPALTAHVIDQAHMLDSAQVHTLNEVLSEYETRTGSQIAILLLNSTAPEAIEQYSIRVADAWKLGRKGVDDGVILIVAKDNPASLRRLRIEAGRGVQGSLTDVQSKRILEDVIAPHFRQNDFYGGLVAGISAISSVLEQEQLPAAVQKKAAQDDGVLAQLAPLLFFILFVVISLFARGRSRGRLGNNTWGSAAGVIIGSVLSQNRGGGGFGGGGDIGGGGISGGGGGFDGGGASGDW